MAKDTVERREFWLATPFVAEHIDRAVHVALDAARSELLANIWCNVGVCESPLEAAFVAWWLALSGANHYELYPRMQQEVDVRDKRWRLDATLVPSGEFKVLDGHPAQPKIAIELDGHEFHERTKAQVTLRNQRDRSLSDAGWTVWHVSGSEFHADPSRVLHGLYHSASTRYIAAMFDAGFWRRPTVTGGH
jgi:hypothetical protein